jgi:peptidoglycan LD-endopeptidase LytH
VLASLLSQKISQNQAVFGCIIPDNLQKGNFLKLDLTENNVELQNIDYKQTTIFHEWLTDKMLENNCPIAAGGYLEKRMIYARSTHFDTPTEPRCIHLGIDLWTKAKTPIFAPLNAKIHSFQNNNHFGDYGPTIILEHILENIRFFTLYGHLSLESLENLYEQKEILKGEKFAEIGDFPINGDWSPHLHFQIIEDMQGKKGDFAGVCTVSEQKIYQNICPNPNLILNMETL